MSKIRAAIYCRKMFDITNNVTFRWMTCGFMQLAMLQFETKLQKCIRMGITIFKIFIWGGILSDIHSEITFYGSACASYDEHMMIHGSDVQNYTPTVKPVLSGH